MDAFSAIIFGISLLFANTHVIFFDPGGSMGDRVHEIRAFQEKGTKIIIAGECYSACTMLAMPEAELDVCMTPDAIFGYHQPYYDEITTPEQIEELKELANMMFEAYHPKVRAFLEENYWPSKINGDDENDLVFMNAYDMEGVIPFCGNKDY